MCIDNINQDAILVIETYSALIIDLNQLAVSRGEFNFLRLLDRMRSLKERGMILPTCALSMPTCSTSSTTAVHRWSGPPEEGKPWSGVDRRAPHRATGVGNFCCSSSKQIDARAEFHPGRTRTGSMGRHEALPVRARKST